MCFFLKNKKADSIKYDKLQALMIVSLSRDYFSMPL